MSADPLDIIAILLIVLTVTGWTATIVLVRAALRTHWRALEERAEVSAILTVARTFIGIFALGHFIDHDAPPQATAILIVGAFLTLGVVDLIWLAAYWSGRFNA